MVNVYVSFMCFCVLPGCGKSKADIVFLVDESSSIGANNFIKMKDFIFRVATYFPVIGPQATQVRVSVKTLFYLVTTLSCGGDDIASRFLNSMEKYGI